MPTKKRPEPQLLSDYLTARLGIAIKVDTGENEEGLFVDLRPADLSLSEGFSVRTILGWRHVRAELTFGTYSRGLLVEMTASTVEQRANFSSLTKYVKSNGGKLSMTIDGAAVDVTNTT